MTKLQYAVNERISSELLLAATSSSKLTLTHTLGTATYITYIHLAANELQLNPGYRSQQKNQPLHRDQMTLSIF